jgi:ubiquinone/menaquinone biosynthesis C-methylase UbiE
MSDYDPKAYWDAKAKSAKGNPMLASCGANQYENQCMHQVQLHALKFAVNQINQQLDIEGKTILDFGCGSGRWVEFFCNLGAKYVGVDISNEMIALSKTRYPDVSFITLTGSKIPLETDSCDLVFSIAVIHHNRPPHQEEILGEFTRVLKPNGYLFLFEGLGTTQWNRLYLHPMREWVRMVEQRNFDCIMHRGYSYFVLCNLMNDTARRFIPRVSSWAARRLHIPRLTSWRPSLLLKLDEKLSPSVSHRLSSKYHDRGAMLFRYRGR